MTLNLITNVFNTQEFERQFVIFFHLLKMLVKLLLLMYLTQKNCIALVLFS